MTFTLEEGRRLTLALGDPQLRHLDHAWASTVHAFQGRTVDNVVATMEANHPQLTTAKAFSVEISHARDRAELVTDDTAALRERLKVVTGEPISALEAIGESIRPERERDGKAPPGSERTSPEVSSPPSPEREVEQSMSRNNVSEPERRPPRASASRWTPASERGAPTRVFRMLPEPTRTCGSAQLELAAAGFKISIGSDTRT